MNKIFSKFMPIWEIESQFRCPVIGAVLSVEKHKQILKKCGYDTKRMKPYEYHQRLMSKLVDKNNVSIKVNNFLFSKARKYMISIHGKTEKEIKEFWKEQINKGNVGPLMYAIVAYEDTSLELLHDVYGEVHMQAHANMTQIHDIRQKLVSADEMIIKERKKTHQKKEGIRQLIKIQKTNHKKIQALEKENLEMKKTIRQLESNLSSFHGPPKPLESLEQKIHDLELQLKRKDEKIRIKEREKRSLQINLFSAKREKELFENQLQELIEGFNAFSPYNALNENHCSEENCSEENCDQYRLCAKKVFMIGGMTKMKSFYKDIVEKAGGKFDYHDGYLKNTAANLEARVKRSDIVICPVNCNSHNACLKVKKLCNRYNKQLKILGNSSLSALSNALFTAQSDTILN